MVIPGRPIRLQPDQQRETSVLAPGDRRARFLHLIPDDKFIDEARDIFEEAMPGSHDYMLVSSDKDLRYLRFTPVRCRIEQALRPDILDQLPDYAAVFIHFLNRSARQIVACAPRDTNFVWIGWGGDYYHLIRRGELLLPDTRELMAGLHDPCRPRGSATALRRLKALPAAMSQPIRSMRSLSRSWRSRRIGPNSPGEPGLLKRFRFFAPVLEEDFSAVADDNPEFCPQFIEWNYWTPGLERSPEVLGKGPSGQNLLLGNSATPQNNHIEVLQALSGTPLGDRKIICPLSYGNPLYGNAIAAAGVDRFGTQFVPLRSFMNATAYTKIIGSCSAVAMNHIRQQAMGNIIMMLWLGARVFLNRESPVNRAMARIGVTVYDIRGLPDYLREGDRPLGADEILGIRDRLEHRFGRVAILQKTHRLLAEVVQGRATATKPSPTST